MNLYTAHSTLIDNVIHPFHCHNNFHFEAINYQSIDVSLKNGVDYGKNTTILLYNIYTGENAWLWHIHSFCLEVLEVKM